MKPYGRMDEERANELTCECHSCQRININDVIIFSQQSSLFEFACSCDFVCFAFGSPTRNFRSLCHRNALHFELQNSSLSLVTGNFFI